LVRRHALLPVDRLRYSGCQANASKAVRRRLSWL
jgi:hypothetical protein